MARSDETKLPRSVVVCGRTYRVLRESLAGDAAGETDHQTCTIKIDSDLRGDAVRRILLHEVLHAMLWETGGGLYLRERLGEHAEEVEEDIVLRLVVGLSTTELP